MCGWFGDRIGLFKVVCGGLYRSYGWFGFVCSSLDIVIVVMVMVMYGGDYGDWWVAWFSVAFECLMMFGVSLLLQVIFIK